MLPITLKRTMTSLIVLNAAAFSFIPFAVKAQNGHGGFRRTSTCATAVATAKRTIENGRQVRVEARRYDINQYSNYASYPSNRPNGYLLLLNGPATDSIMNSPVFMEAVATDILETCDSASAVRIAPGYGTGWHAIYGLIDGDVQPFECIEDLYGDDFDTYPARTPWGYQYCTL